jgi:hypothetical protein
LTLVAGFVGALETGRATLITNYKDLRENGLKHQAALRSTAMEIFSVNGGRGKQERAQYSTELHIWYRTQMTIVDSGLSSCVGNIRTLDGALNFFPGLFDPILSSAHGSPAGFPIAAAFDRLKEPLARLAGKCEFSINSNPPELKPAGQWGPFGAIARWLLGAESLDLALITGMLGFGLFGASISTLVRRGALLESPNQAPIADLVGVIIRGLSAAIVVFLATLGGLAIFSVSQAGQMTEPNPYALFLTCLAAAVFSEDVWLRVRRRLREQAGSTKADESGTQTSGDSSPAGDPSGPQVKRNEMQE